MCNCTWGNLEIPGPREVACPGMTAEHRAHGCKEHFRSRPGQKTPISLQIMRVVPTSLDIWGPADITAQPLGSSSRKMRNKITKLLIVVVPRRTAGDG